MRCSACRLRRALGASSRYEEALGFVVLDIVIALVATAAIRQTQLDPMVGGVNGATELFGIDKGFDHQHGMAVAGLPIIAEAPERQTQHARSQIGHGAAG